MSKWAVKLGSPGGGFVESFEFTKTGVEMKFTQDLEKAARVSSLDVAQAIARCIGFRSKAFPVRAGE